MTEHTPNGEILAESLKEQMRDKAPEEILSWAFTYFNRDEIAVASSLGAEDQVLTDLAVLADSEVAVFTLDTGRIFQETYNLIEKTNKHYGIRIQMLFPDFRDVERMTNEAGPNLFFHSIESRKRCCKVRKILPLRRKLSGLKAWVCGLRRSQSVTRSSLQKVEWDAGNSIIKINPLADCSEEEIWTYLRRNKVPYNELHERGYPSIGCAPCTRAIEEGEDVRAGRWWWEDPALKECGLHGRK